MIQRGCHQRGCRQHRIDFDEKIGWFIRPLISAVAWMYTLAFTYLLRRLHRNPLWQVSLVLNNRILLFNVIVMCFRGQRLRDIGPLVQRELSHSKESIGCHELSSVNGLAVFNNHDLQNDRPCLAVLLARNASLSDPQMSS